LLRIEDSVAPPVKTDERVKGGTWLLRAQAICPAWAYFQFRLGAKQLEEPAEGLDSRKRGTLVHAVLENFWREVKSSERLHSLGAEGIEREIIRAVDMALAAHDENPRNSKLKTRCRQLEKARLIKLVQGWIEWELSREIPFEVVALEDSPPVNIGGIEVAIQPDRVDRLAGGELLVIDYKTGASIDTKNWALERITEPQLPAYASVPKHGESKVAGVVFAKVLLSEPSIAGLAGVADLIPGLPAFNSSRLRKLYPEEEYPEWENVLEAWNARLHAIAQEIQQGEAAVRFSDENDLKYCDVKPLLRLSERKEQLLKIRKPIGGEQ